jgi:hypothetical protein
MNTKNNKLTDNEIADLQTGLLPLYDYHDAGMQEAGADRFLPTTYTSLFQRTHGVTIVVHVDAQIPDTLADSITDSLFDQIDQLNPTAQRDLFLLRIRVSDSTDKSYAGHYMPWVNYQMLWPPRNKEYIGQHRAGLITIARSTIDEDGGDSALRTIQHELWHCIDDIFKQTQEMQTGGSPSQHKAANINHLIMKHVMAAYNDDTDLAEWLESGIIDACFTGMDGYLKQPPEDFVHRSMSEQYGVEPYTHTAYYLSHGSHTNIARMGIELLNAWDLHSREDSKYVPKQYRRQLANAIVQSIPISTGHRPALMKELKRMPSTISKYFR